MVLESDGYLESNGYVIPYLQRNGYGVSRCSGQRTAASSQHTAYSRQQTEGGGTDMRAFSSLVTSSACVCVCVCLCVCVCVRVCVCVLC
jgi:hypothetical protein